MRLLLNPDDGGNLGASSGLLGGPIPGTEQPNTAAAPAATVEEREWMKGLTDPTLKASKSLSKFKDIEPLAKSYVELEGRLGRSITLPAQDASPEEWAKVYERLGRPKSPDEYAINRGKADDVLASTLKKALFEMGASSAGADKVFGAVNQVLEASQRSQAEAYTARMKEADSVLRNEYGPQYDARIADAKKAYDLLFDADTRNDIAASGLAANPRFIKVLAALGPQLRGDSFLQGVGSSGSQTKKDPLSWMDEKYGSGK